MPDVAVKMLTGRVLNFVVGIVSLIIIIVIIAGISECCPPLTSHVSTCNGWNEFVNAANSLFLGTPKTMNVSQPAL